VNGKLAPKARKVKRQLIDRIVRPDGSAISETENWAREKFTGASPLQASRQGTADFRSRISSCQLGVLFVAVPGKQNFSM
jgi:hypothetical protein